MWSSPSSGFISPSLWSSPFLTSSPWPVLPALVSPLQPELPAPVVEPEPQPEAACVAPGRTTRLPDNRPAIPRPARYFLRSFFSMIISLYWIHPCQPKLPPRELESKYHRKRQLQQENKIYPTNSLAGDLSGRRNSIKIFTQDGFSALGALGQRFLELFDVLQTGLFEGRMRGSGRNNGHRIARISAEYVHIDRPARFDGL